MKTRNESRFATSALAASLSLALLVACGDAAAACTPQSRQDDIDAARTELEAARRFLEDRRAHLSRVERNADVAEKDLEESLQLRIHDGNNELSPEANRLFESQQLSANVAASQVANARAEVEAAATAEDQAQSNLEKEKSAASFDDLHFGVGLGVAFGDSDQVSDAVIEDGVVRVTKTERDQVRAVLEAHKLVHFWGNECEYGVGPFVSTQTGGEDGALSSFGIGLMFGIKDVITDVENAGWSLGVGYYIDNGVRKLGDGLIDGQSAGDRELSFRTESDDGVILLFSRTF